MERGRDAAERIARLTHDLKVSTHQREKLAQKFTAKERELGALENRVRLQLLVWRFQATCTLAYAVPMVAGPSRATIQSHNNSQPQGSHKFCMSTSMGQSRASLTVVQCCFHLAYDMASSVCSRLLFTVLAAFAEAAHCRGADAVEGDRTENRTGQAEG